MANIGSEELKILVQRIISSGVLGRSQTYAAILMYLLECSENGQAPKEIAIAIDVLGRDPDFDVGKDSIVRVHLYHLRNKLNTYYSKYGKNEKYRIDIPKGQYIITTSLNSESDDGKANGAAMSLGAWSWLPRPWILLMLALLVVANVYQYAGSRAEAFQQIEGVANVGPWQAMLDDETPIMIVIGDYYIFGELDEAGNVARMVREFDINSEEDLVFEQARQDDHLDYFNLDLSYIPTSSAYALTSIMPVFANDSERVKVKMMSELSTADLVANHIVYIGYLSGLGDLNDLMFASSDLAIGATYDELYHLETDEYFFSSSGLSFGENSFKDYGMLATFPSPNGNQFVMIAGMRDEGLINLAQEVTNVVELSRLEAGLGIVGSNAVRAYEALYEVVGYDNTNFDADLVYSNILKTDIIWEARLISNQER